MMMLITTMMVMCSILFIQSINNLHSIHDDNFELCLSAYIYIYELSSNIGSIKAMDCEENVGLPRKSM